MILKFVVCRIGELVHRLEAALLAMAAERRCALSLERIGERLAGMGDRINLLRARIGEGPSDAALDPDCCLCDCLKGLKADIRDIRRQLSMLQGTRLSARLQRATARLASIAEHTYLSADRLQWEIGEHDRPWAVQLAHAQHQAASGAADSMHLA